MADVSFRTRLEQRSAAPLVFLRSLPRVVPPLLLLVVAAVGLVVEGVVGAILLFVVAAFLGWLAALSWPVLDQRAQFLRVASIALIAVAGALMLRG